MKRRWGGRAVRAPFALALAFVLAAALWQSVPAAVDVGKRCGLTVAPGAEEWRADLAEAGVVYDLYKVAEVLPLSGSDGYTFGMLPAYADLTVPEDVTAENWEALAREAARTALAEGSEETPAVAGAAPDTRVETAPGLYLLIAHGADLEEKTDYVKGGAGEGGAGEDDAEPLATVAYSRTYEYTFAPELVALPTRPADENGYVGTDSPGEWLYEVDAALKPERSERYGTLAITKSLDSYETQDPATFVFQVDAYTDEGMAELAYSDVVSLTFTEPGVREALVEGRIPAGSYVVVTEVYSGASYRLTTPAEQAVTVSAEETAQVRFSNTYDGNRRGGSGIANTFTYGDGRWQWTAGEE